MKRLREVAVDCVIAGLLLLLLALLAAMVSVGAYARAQTLTLSPATVIQSAPYRQGINLDHCTNYDNGQIYKNLLGCDDPGFEPLLLRQTWAQSAASGDKVTFTIPNPYADGLLVANRFVGAHYTLTNPSSPNYGCTGTITASSAPTYPTDPTYTLSAPTNCGGVMPANLIAGELISVTLLESPTAETTWENAPNPLVKCTVTNSGKATSDVTTPYDGLQSMVLDATANGSSSAQCTMYFDGGYNKWVVLNGIYQMQMATKLISGSATGLTMTVVRTSGGVNCTWTPTMITSWALQTNSSCTPTENNTGPNTVAVTMTVANGTKAEIDDVGFQKTSGQDSTNTTVFRDEYVAALRVRCGAQTGPKCPIRYWENNNGETMDTTSPGGASWITTAFAAPITGAGLGSKISGDGQPERLQDYLALVKLLNGEPYIAVPCPFGNLEATNFIDYLQSTNTSSGYGALRAAQGHPLPYVGTTGDFQSAHVSMCNEAWNTTFAGQNFPYRASAPSNNTYYDYANRYGSWAAAIRGDANYTSAVQLGFNCQLGCGAGSPSPAHDAFVQAGGLGGAPDYAEQAPYGFGQMSNSASDAEWPDIFALAYGYGANPSGFNAFNASVTGVQGLSLCGASKTAVCGTMDYEQNMNAVEDCSTSGASPACGSGYAAGTQLAFDQANAGCGEAIAIFRQFVTNANILKVPIQNVWSSVEYQNNTYPGTTATVQKGYGDVVDYGGATSLLNASLFGGSYTPRGPFLAAELANQTIIGPLVTATITGTGTTYNYAGSVYNGPVPAQTSVPYLDVLFSKDGGNNRTMAIDNTSSSPFTLTLAGSDLPTGTVAVNGLTCSSLDALNEAGSGSATNTTSASYSLASSSLSSPTTVTIPAYSIRTFAWNVGSVSPASGVTLSGGITLSGGVKVQ